MKIKKKTLQIIGGIVLLVVILLVGYGIVNRDNSTTDAARVNDIAANIVNFELPEGYVPAFGIKDSGKSLVIFNRADGQGRIVIMQDENQDLINEETVRTYLQQLGQDTGRLEGPQLLSTKGFEMGIATTSGGFTKDGTAALQTVVVFYGKKGGAFMSIESIADAWNVDQVRALLDSMNRG